ncbi:Imm30 family immunity protein [Aneurinibacillus aneurinilyticus]|uniref:Immunity protein 30 domain-containing protein n=1 Tax=Aneurinibacillus aneurinilyticus TaxID=1391 RepID=A0A848D1R4_ANEAE|nr:hypothetical protein [Aneurinibacillus aneurinilyticus]
MSIYQIRCIYNCRLPRDQSECEEFNHILDKLADCTEEKIIRDLCMIFDDKIQEEEIMFGLIYFFVSSQFFLICLIRKLPKIWYSNSEPLCSTSPFSCRPMPAFFIFRIANENPLPL